MMRGLRALLLFACAFTTARAGALVPDLDAAQLEPASARQIANATFDLGAGRIELTRGLLVPTTPVEGVVVEWVFVGEGRLAFAPKDVVEQQQLQLFAGAGALDVSFSRAVLVGCPPALLAAHAGGGAVQDAEAADALKSAREHYAAWRPGVERLDSVALRLSRALDHADARAALNAVIETTNLGRFVVESRPVPSARVTVRQFVPATMTASERFEIEKQIESGVRAGHYGWLDFARLGTWNTWSDVRDITLPEWGLGAFEVRRYVLDLTVQKGGEEISGRGTLRLAARRAGERVLSLSLAPDLVVDRVLDDRDRALGFVRRASGLDVALAEAPAVASPVEVRVEYHGPLLTRVRRGVYYTWSTETWYPVCGWELAPYEVTLHWPKRLSLVASGHRVDGGEANGERWERRVLEVPTDLFGFQVGDFEIREQTFGHVRCTIAVDKLTRENYRDWAKVFLSASARDIVRSYEEVFGKYPLDELVIVTTWQEDSQGMLGFVTLSAAGFEYADANLTLAHEIAHQWWGHRLRHAADRDYWLMEGLATYTAGWYARSLTRQQLTTLGWSRDLFRQNERGQPIESTGAVVLGRRADSTLCPGCDIEYLYLKAPLVLETLAVTIGEQTFNAVLRELADDSAPLTTEVLLARLAKKSNRSLREFADRFVYGTGIDYLFYRATFDPEPPGSRIRIHVEAMKSPDVRVRIVRTASGALDVLRKAPDTPPASGYSVPFRAYEKSATGTKAVPDLLAFGRYSVRGLERLLDGELDLLEEAPLRRKGRFAYDVLPITGPVSDFSAAVPVVVDEVLLDPERLTFTRVIDESKYPALANAYRTEIELVTDPVRAEASLRKALAAPPQPPAPGKSGRDPRVAEAGLRVLLARALLDQGRIADARAELERVTAPGVVGAVDFATESGRLASLDGDAKRAFKPLWKILREGENHPAASWAVMAIVARGAGEKSVYERALAKAKKLGVDVTELECADAPH